jgi:hypothetical protein
VRSLAMRERILGIYVDHYRRLHALACTTDPDLPEIPDEFLRALVGGVAELVQQCLLEDAEVDVSERLHALTPVLVSFATAILTNGGERVAVPVPAAG